MSLSGAQEWVQQSSLLPRRPPCGAIPRWTKPAAHPESFSLVLLQVTCGPPASVSH